MNLAEAYGRLAEHAEEARILRTYYRILWTTPARWSFWTTLFFVYVLQSFQ
jgi:hypothetical protein